MTQISSERHWSSSSDRADTFKFPDFDQSISIGDPLVTQEEERDRVPSPRPRSKPNGSLYGDRWQHRRDNHIAWDNGHATVPSGPSRHKRQPSLSDAIRTIRTRKGSVSANAHEIAEALKAPISFKLIVGSTNFTNSQKSHSHRLATLHHLVHELRPHKYFLQIHPQHISAADHTYPDPICICLLLVSLLRLPCLPCPAAQVRHARSSTRY